MKTTPCVWETLHRPAMVRGRGTTASACSHSTACWTAARHSRTPAPLARDLSASARAPGARAPRRTRTRGPWWRRASSSWESESSISGAGGGSRSWSRGAQRERGVGAAFRSSRGAQLPLTPARGSHPR
eukprot:scaffold91584_cov50-Phaeocystis_antarctica.AAC.1